MSKNFVAYYRVSTAKQGKSGLGIEAQQAAVQKFIGDGTLLAEFWEIESGKRSDRPELEKALEWCRLTRSVLIVAKLDRLTRDVGFLVKLRDSGVEFVAVDNASATQLTVTILIAVAEEERRLASERTKAALQAAKARGKKLGCPLGAAAFGDRIRVGAVEAVKEKADKFAQGIGRVILPWREEGLNLKQIADRLNEQGILTARGGKWQATSVRRVLDRL